MTTPRTSTIALVSAWMDIANNLHSDYGATKFVITESAQRLLELHELLKLCLPHVQSAVQSEHTLSCTGPRHELPIDRLLGEVKAALK